MEMSNSIGKLAKALSQFQAEVKAPGKNAENPQYKSRYATLDDCIAVIKDTAPKFGLSYIQSLGTIDEQSAITTLIMHESGEWVKTDVATAPALQKRKDNGVEFNAQGVGSSATYLRRYSLVAAFGLASEEDDDGNSVGGRSDIPASGSKQESANVGQQKLQEQKAKAAYTSNQPTGDKISEAQLKLFATKAKISGFKSPEQVAHFKAELLEKFGVNEPADLPKSKFNAALEWITTTTAPMETNVGLNDQDLPF